MADSLQTLPDLIRHWGSERPDDEVFTFVTKHGRTGVYTPQDILRLASRFATLLRQDYGFCAGDVVSNALPNSPERLVTDMGILMAGCVMVNCQVLEKDGSDMWNTLRLAGSKGVILPAHAGTAPFCLFESLLQPSSQAQNTSNIPKAQPHQTQSQRQASTQGFATLHVPDAPDLGKVILVNRYPLSTSQFHIDQPFLDRLKSLSRDSSIFPVSPDDLAVLFATSGSSGFCKLVPRTHREILDAARAFKGAKDSRYFSDRAFGWMGGFPFDFFAYCAVRVLQDILSNDEATSPRDLWAVITREKCTGAAIVPVTLDEMIREFEHQKPDYVLPAIVTTGMPIRETLSRALGLLSHALVVAYASTEVGMISMAVITAPGQLSDFLSGRPPPDIQVKIVDDQGREVPRGSDGLMLIKSPRMMRGYYNQPGETERHLAPDGFLQTGDRGSLDEQGNLYCLGRDGDAVMQGSVVVYSSWPEGILARCPSVHQVAVVVLSPPGSAPGERYFCACVVPKKGCDLTEEKLLDFYQNSFFGRKTLGGQSSTTDTSNLSSTESEASSPTEASGSTYAGNRRKGYMIELKKIIFLSEIPLTATGKINKRELVALASIDNT